MYKQMKRISLVVLIVLLLAACAPAETASAPTNGLAPEKFRKYVGVSYPPLPDGFSEDMAMLIQNAEDHSLSLVSDGENKMLLLGEMTSSSSSSNVKWEVRDILDLSDVEAGVMFVPDACSLNGTPDSEILAIRKDGALLQAWRANTKSNVFEVIPVDGVECQSDKELSL